MKTYWVAICDRCEAYKPIGYLCVCREPHIEHRITIAQYPSWDDIMRQVTRAVIREYTVALELFRHTNGQIELMIRIPEGMTIEDFRRVGDFMTLEEYAKR